MSRGAIFQNGWNVVQSLPYGRRVYGVYIDYVEA